MENSKQFFDPSDEVWEGVSEQIKTNEKQSENDSEKKEQVWERVYEGWDGCDLQLEKEEGLKVYKIIEEAEMTESEKELWGPYKTKHYRVGLGIEPDAIAQAERLLKGENEDFHPDCLRVKELEPDCEWRGKFKDGEWKIENSNSLYFFQNEKRKYGLQSEQIKKPAERLEEHNIGEGEKILQEITDYVRQNLSDEMLHGVLALCSSAAFFGAALTSKGAESAIMAGAGTIVATVAVKMFVKEASNRFKANYYAQMKKQG